MYIDKEKTKELMQALKTIETILNESETKHHEKRELKQVTEKQKANFEKQRKLTDFEVKAIKHLYNTGKYSMRDLGAKYNVSRQTICDIVRENTRYSRGDV